MKTLLSKLLQLVGLQPKELHPHATDAEGNKIGLFSILLNQNDPIIYSTRKMALEGLFIRGNPDGSEDLVKPTHEGYALVKPLCGPGQGKFAYLITKASRAGKYEYLETARKAAALNMRQP
jgi:hypothetical protein